MTTLHLIAAIGPGGAVGANGELPWSRIEPDLQYFRRVTLGCPVIMGRGTFESLGYRPLPGRMNIVVSKTLNVRGGFIQADSLPQALSYCRSWPDTFVIGGPQLWEEAMPEVQVAHITWVRSGVLEADTFFHFDAAKFPRSRLIDQQRAAYEIRRYER